VIDTIRQHFFAMSSITVEKMFALVMLISREINEESSNPETKSSDDDFLQIKSHDLRNYFISRNMHPRKAFPQYFSDSAPRAVLTYEWGMTFKEIQGFLNHDTLKSHNATRSARYAVSNAFYL
jgi:hypothetical protein